MVDSIDISLYFDGSELFPPLKIRNTLANFISLGNCLVCMLLLMRIAIIGPRLFIASLKILGPGPFNPVVFDGSKSFMYECTCSDVTNRILK